LWGKSEDERKINWVSWDNMCRPLEEGGMGIKLGSFRDMGVENKIREC